MNYANRDIEYGTLRQLIENGSNPIFIYAYHASGVTSFVKMRMKAVCTSLFDTNIIYIDASKGRPLSELLLTQLVRSDYLEQLQQFADKKWGGTCTIPSISGIRGDTICWSYSKSFVRTQCCSSSLFRCLSFSDGRSSYSFF